MGRGIADALGEVGATVCLTGRDERALAEATESVSALGSWLASFTQRT